MKKNTRISVPRRVVLPLAAAALLGACDASTPTYKTTNVVPGKARSTAADRARPAATRRLDDDRASATGKSKNAMQRSAARASQA
ncbi:MAG: hypothetical protein M3Z31_05075 [Pseudomonadota bacterium]|nr:hypothetical protein [Pseudomonadota bacterium]